MTCDIDNEETRRPTRALAEPTGENACEAVSAALRERPERETRKRSVERRLHEMRAIAKRCAALMGPDGPGSRDIDALLYDEQGLPVRGGDFALTGIEPA